MYESIKELIAPLFFANGVTLIVLVLLVRGLRVSSFGGDSVYRMFTNLWTIFACVMNVCFVIVTLVFFGWTIIMYV